MIRLKIRVSMVRFRPRPPLQSGTYEHTALGLRGVVSILFPYLSGVKTAFALLLMNFERLIREDSRIRWAVGGTESVPRQVVRRMDSKQDISYVWSGFGRQKAIGALRRIAGESPLNAVRVRRYGVETDEAQAVDSGSLPPDAAR